VNIVIVGVGEVGFHLADMLSREEHAVAVIDQDPVKGQRLMESLDVQAIVGDGTRADKLAEAGASKADLVVAVSDNDQVNMLVSTVAKALGAKRCILRLRDTSRLENYHYFYKQTLGFDVVLSTEELAAEEILETVREHHALEVESFADGRVQLRRVRLREESELTSAPIAELRLPPGVLIVAVARKDSFVLPDGDHQLGKDDQIYIIGEADNLDAFERLSGERTATSRRVVIMGAGGIGRQVTRKLRGLRGISVRVIENNSGRADALAAECSSDEVMVLRGDATDTDLLNEERIGEANVFVATTKNDESNMVACQLARSLGVERTVAMINKRAYRLTYDLLGIDRAISPRVLCATHILRFVRSGSVSSISVIGDGRAEVLELGVNLEKGQDSVKLKNLGLPKGAVLGALVHDEQVIIPHGETQLHSGDHAIVFTLPEVIERVERLFRGA